MRSNLLARIISGTAVLTLLSSGAVFAQSQPVATPPPDVFPDVSTSVILNELTGASTNVLIDQAAQAAHRQIGGKISTGRKNGYFPVTLPDTPSVVRAAQNMVRDFDNDLVVITGGDSQSTVGFAAGFPDTVFIDVGQPVPCVTLDGRPDPSGTCEGGTVAIPFNYGAIEFEVEDAAYLAGVLAAAASRDDRLGIISGLIDCTECNRYVQGFTLGAQSVKPEIDIELAYLTDDDEAQAFGDTTTAKTFAKAFIDVYRPDVLLPIAQDASIGMIQAACEAGILAVGTNKDVASEHPELADCVLTSAVKDVAYAVREGIYAFANASTQREWSLGLDDGRVGVTSEWQRLPTLPVDTSERFQAAETAIITGQVETCPADCGAPIATSSGPEDVEGATDES
jgi:basic membrane lipoprotein Med (substrate-binding protein (PBP1-ABC) superfamily)